MNTKELFPEGKWSQQKNVEQDWLSLPLAEGGYFSLKREQLTEREQYLVSLLNREEVAVSHSSWYRYLVKEEVAMPASNSKRYQFVYIKKKKKRVEGSKTWRVLLRSFFTPSLAEFSLREDVWVFVLSQDTYMEVLSGLQEMLPVLEFDTGVPLSILVGRVWSKEGGTPLPRVFQDELRLFEEVLKQDEQTGAWSLSQFYQRALAHNLCSSTLILKDLRRILHQFEQLEETVFMLWREGAVLTKVAQKLYIHRNTLQYRLEKFRNQTGLDLKKLDDLFLCYLALL